MRKVTLSRHYPGKQKMEADDNMSGRVRTGVDEIDVAMNEDGARVPELARLRDLATRIEEIEWELARRTARAE